FIRLNEVAVFVDGSGKGGRAPDKDCYAVSFNPSNPARKPILVQRGGLKGWEDSDDKGVLAAARTEDRSRWTAEIALDLDRFCGGAPPREIRLAFRVAGQRADQLRLLPDGAQTPTSPRGWMIARLKP
ncbi:MAG TPA: hypothetical protein VEI02_02020, partial [Planctomycetota bacterium]|nr:hypothetical protein [Planctomycetota bacterium]